MCRMLWPTYSRAPESYAACSTRSQPVGGDRQRLLHEHRDAGLEEVDRRLLVQVVRRGQEDPVELLVEQLGVVGVRGRIRVPLEGQVPLRRDRVADGDDRGALAGLVRVLRDAAAGAETHHDRTEDHVIS